MEYNMLDILFSKGNSFEYTILTKSKCKFCKEVQDVVVKHNKSMNVVNCDEYLTDKQIKEEFLKQIEQRIGKTYSMFPMVFRNNVFIGGCEETIKFIENSIAITPNEELDF